MGGLLHLVQQGWAWASCGPAQSPPRSTECNSPPSVPIIVLLYDGPLLCGFNVAIKGLRMLLRSAGGGVPPGASDRQRLAVFIRRSDRSRFVPANLPTFADLCHDAAEKMFAAITSDRNHVLHHLLPPQSTGSQNYNLRQRTHSLAVPSRTGHLTDNNFIQRMLYSDVIY